MKEVVDHGTGTALQAAKWPLAGKSGTAQLTLKNGKPGENHWFIGYGPADQPVTPLPFWYRMCRKDTATSPFLCSRKSWTFLLLRKSSDKRMSAGKGSEWKTGAFSYFACHVYAALNVLNGPISNHHAESCSLNARRIIWRPQRLTSSAVIPTPWSMISIHTV